MIHIATDLPMMQYEMFHFSGQQCLSHYHARFMYLLKGTASIQLNRQDIVIGSGDLLFLPPQQEYRISSSSCLVLYICFHPYLLLTALGQKGEQIQTLYTEEQPKLRTALNHQIAGFVTACLSQTEDSCEQYARACDMLHFVCTHCLSAKSPYAQDKVSQKLAALADYLDKHYMETVSLSDAACALSYTPPYLSNFLKKHLNITFQEYLNRFRVHTAQVLLRYTTEPLSRVSSLSGFANQHSFLKCFQKETSLPAEEYCRQYRIQIADEQALDGILVSNPPLVSDYLFNYMNYSTLPPSAKRKMLPEQIILSEWNYSAMPHVWNFLINMGSANDYEKPTFRRHLCVLQQRLHFQYGRCTEVFALIKVYTLDRKQYYDFTRLFRLIDFMNSIHLKPFFDIDAKPFRLYKAPENSIPNYRDYLSADAYDEFLVTVLPEFLRACITRYGFDEFSTWRFELWRRYNFNMSSLESPQDFCRRFQQVAGILKKLVPDAQLGGPGFNGFLDTDSFQALLAPFENADYRPDFISAYYFPYLAPSQDDENTGGYTVASTPNAMVKRLSEWKQMLAKTVFATAPLYITEYSAHLSVENYINDSIYAAVSTLYQGIFASDLVDGLGYWLATDLSLDYGRPNAPFFGGNGLISKQGIRKPTFYAHDFLNHLGCFVLKRGEHYIVTTAADHSVQMLVFHFGTLRQSFSQAPATQDMLQYPYSAFEEMPPLDIQITLPPLPCEHYLIKEWSLDLNHGNALHIWGELNYSRSLGMEEIRYMNSQSIPSMKIHSMDFSDPYTFHAVLNYNEAKLVILQPQY